MKFMTTIQKIKFALTFVWLLNYLKYGRLHAPQPTQGITIVGQATNTQTVAGQATGVQQPVPPPLPPLPNSLANDLTAMNKTLEEVDSHFYVQSSTFENAVEKLVLRLAPIWTTFAATANLLLGNARAAIEREPIDLLHTPYNS